MGNLTGSVSAIWARLLDSREIPAETARFLLSIEFLESDHERMQHLADRSQEGLLTPPEECEYDAYLQVGNVLSMMQSKARVRLGVKLQISPDEPL
ncbi:MAG: hypothetical protein U0Q16_08830 [Bryobacteraceae bacterium]